LGGLLKKTAFSRGRMAPSLNALHTFEAAARLWSLTKAAEELNVTVSAVAFQIRQVEQAFGLKLIARSGRSVDVSREGVLLAAELAGPFDAIRSTAERYQSLATSPDVVTVSVLPSFASMWLLPRLPELQAKFPGLDLRISTSERRVKLISERIDCAIRCGSGEWPELEATYLFPQRLAPLCHASYIARTGPLTNAQDLTAHALIANRTRPSEWDEWLSAADATAAKPVQLVDNRELVLSAIRAGLGIGMLDVSVLERELSAGDLIQPFQEELHTGWGHFFVSPAGRQLSSACEVFRSWVLEQARCTPNAAIR
jgi:LysR family glycine cleavage system transcriptional activator